MFHHRPHFAVELLAGVLGHAVPPYTGARLDAVDAEGMTFGVPSADAVIVLTGVDGQPALAIVVEVQVASDPEAFRNWPVYVTALYFRLHCPAALLVVCVDVDVARWAAEPIDLGQPGSRLVPLVVGPEQVPVVDDVAAARSPELAVLSAIAHGSCPERSGVLDTLARVLPSVEEQHAFLYLGLVYAHLSDAARVHLEGSYRSVRNG